MSEAQQPARLAQDVPAVPNDTVVHRMMDRTIGPKMPQIPPFRAHLFRFCGPAASVFTVGLALAACEKARAVGNVDAFCRRAENPTHQPAEGWADCKATYRFPAVPAYRGLSPTATCGRRRAAGRLPYP